MALLFIDSFDAGDVDIKWDLNDGNVASTAITRFNAGRSLRLTSGFSTRKNITASAQVIVGWALHVVGASDNPNISIRADGGATTHLTLMRNTSSGRLELRRGTTAGTLLATGNTTINAGIWYYVEFQSTIADAGGIGVVRINGSSTPDINFSGDTKNAGTSTNIDAVAVTMAGSGTAYIDDLYMLNSTGTSNNTFLGDVRIHTLIPNGNGNSSQLTGSDGNQTDNYLLVDELPYSTADYAGSATTGNKDTYTLSNLPGGVTSVFGVQNNMIAAKSDATAGSARAILRTGGTDFTGTTQALGTSYLNYRELYNTNPSTTTAWTTTDVDGLEAGMEVM